MVQPSKYIQDLAFLPPVTTILVQTPSNVTRVGTVASYLMPLGLPLAPTRLISTPASGTLPKYKLGNLIENKYKEAVWTLKTDGFLSLVKSKVRAKTDKAYAVCSPPPQSGFIFRIS